MISDQAEMDKKKDKDQNWLEHNLAMAKIEFSDTCKSLQHRSSKTLILKS